MEQKSEHTIVFFDGICNFCNSSVDYLIRHNKKRDLRYTSLQSDFATDTLKKHGINSADLNSIYILKSDKIHDKSSAVLRLIPHLNWYFLPIYPFLIIPKRIRDFFYNIIAKKRYLILGKRESCRIPTKEEQELFIS